MENAQKFHSFLRSQAAELGPVITRIPVAWNPDGTVQEFKSIVDQYQTIELKHVQQAAHNRFATAIAPGAPVPNGPWNVCRIDPANNNADKDTFYDRVHAHAVTVWMSNSLDSMTLEALALEKDKYTFLTLRESRNKMGLLSYLSSSRQSTPPPQSTLRTIA